MKFEKVKKSFFVSLLCLLVVLFLFGTIGLYVNADSLIVDLDIYNSPYEGSEFSYERVLVVTNDDSNTAQLTTRTTLNNGKLDALKNVTNVKSVTEITAPMREKLSLEGSNSFNSLSENTSDNFKSVFSVELEEKGRDFWIRLVIVPGYSDDKADLRTIGETFGCFKHVRRVELLPYHTLGVHKYEALGKPYRLTDVSEPSKEDMEVVQQLLQGYFTVPVVIN